MRQNRWIMDVTIITDWTWPSCLIIRANFSRRNGVIISHGIRSPCRYHTFGYSPVLHSAGKYALNLGYWHMRWLIWSTSSASDLQIVDSPRIFWIMGQLMYANAMCVNMWRRGLDGGGADTRIRCWLLSNCFSMCCVIITFAIIDD